MDGDTGTSPICVLSMCFPIDLPRSYSTKAWGPPLRACLGPRTRGGVPYLGHQASKTVPSTFYIHPPPLSSASGYCPAEGSLESSRLTALPSQAVSPVLGKLSMYAFCLLRTKGWRMANSLSPMYSKVSPAGGITSPDRWEPVYLFLGMPSRGSCIPTRGSKLSTSQEGSRGLDPRGPLPSLAQSPNCANLWWRSPFLS